jgi:hypothetical protein
MKFFLTVLNIILEFNTKEIKDMVMKVRMMRMMMNNNKKIKRKRNHQKKKKNLNQKERVIKELQVKNLNAKTNELINVI